MVVAAIDPGREKCGLAIVTEDGRVLDQAVVDQAIRYNRVLDVRYIAITNGPKTFFFERHGEQFDFLPKAPLWREMV